MKTFKQIVLVVLDGFGVASSSEGNAVAAAQARSMNYLINNFPAITLQASGPSVGLSWGERGNSEVGHLNLGTGRIVTQDMVRVNESISSGDFLVVPYVVSKKGNVEIEKHRPGKSKIYAVNAFQDDYKLYFAVQGWVL